MNTNKTSISELKQLVFNSKNIVIEETMRPFKRMKGCISNYGLLLNDTGLFQRIAASSIKTYKVQYDDATAVEDELEKRHQFEGNFFSFRCELAPENKKEFFENTVYAFKDEKELNDYITTLASLFEDQKMFSLYCTVGEDERVWRYKVKIESFIKDTNGEVEIYFDYSALNVTAFLKI